MTDEDEKKRPDAFLTDAEKALTHSVALVEIVLKLLIAKGVLSTTDVIEHLSSVEAVLQPNDRIDPRPLQAVLRLICRHLERDDAGIKPPQLQVIEGGLSDDEGQSSR
jgi:hypothetical protein